MANRIEDGFVKADSRNIPTVTQDMIAKYFIEHADFFSAEFKGIKFTRSSNEAYGDAAVGYVQVKRMGSIVICKAILTPEHRVRSKGYTVTVTVNEATSEIVTSICNDCAASKGGCKHGIAIAFWLHRRTEEKSVTDVACYWRKSDLSKVGTQTRYIKLSQMAAVQLEHTNASATVASKFCEENVEKDSNCTYLQLYSTPAFATLSIHHLFADYVEGDTSGTISADHFLDYCANHMRQEQCMAAAESTKDQSDSVLWFELRYGRITASKLYEASKCKTEAGSLVQRIFGATKFVSTEAMTRGLRLEHRVIQEVERRLAISTKRCGLMLDATLSIFGASPDAVSDASVIEVKCPSTSTTVENYIRNGAIVGKYEAQMQLQMKMYDKKHAIFAVADPRFEENNNVQIQHLDYNEQLCIQLLHEAKQFWTKYIFPALPRL